MKFIFIHFFNFSVSKKAIILSILSLNCVFTFSQNKSFPEKLDAVKTAGSELTKNSSTDNTSIGQSGVMSTSIPLVEVKSRTMSFPLELNYNAGIKVNESSGAVGLGWVMPIGSIVRDFGAFEPDYTSTSGELKMLNSGGGVPPGWLNPNGNAIHPGANGQYLGYDAVKTENGYDFPLSDEYHVSVPGFISNTFWNKGALNTNHDWAFKNFEKNKVNSTKKTYTISQEYSRINELNNLPGGPTGDWLTNKEIFNSDWSYASAIGVLPYVINGRANVPTSAGTTLSPLEGTVDYEDFEKFIITDENGTRYVFGRALRGQKFVFNDDPYWSTKPDFSQGNVSVGHFWKIDYIAEWLLTEILSVDYLDINNNGKADDADDGDWIRFEYSEPTKVENTAFEEYTFNQTVPTYREWSSFSQTDMESSLMREKAYLTKIVTPIQEVDLKISQRFDVDFDYYSKPANKVGDSFFYEDRHYGLYGSSEDFDVVYPLETMKYDSIKIYSRLFDKVLYPNSNNFLGAVVLNYAQKGSSEELAVSNYLIRDNTNTDKLNDKPSEDNFDIESYYNATIGRGKTTLLSVDYLGKDLNPNEKTSYTFEYGFNPKYDEIHKREIMRKYYFPSLRQAISPFGFIADLENESEISYKEKILDTDGLPTSEQNHVNIYAHEFLIDFPYQENWKKYSSISNAQISSFVVSENLPSNSLYNVPITHPIKPIMDVFGYFYGEGCEKCPQAWSLTKINHPTGGSVAFEYENGVFEKSIDNPLWSIKENNVPLIKEYNDLAEERSSKQDLYNKYIDNIGFSEDPVIRKTLTASYSVELPETFGIRLKKKTIDDRVNSPVVTNYDYGNGHFTSLPSDYLSNYINGFNSFIIKERFRHSGEVYWKKRSN